eukprot:2533971-Amphidinium_carterae.2
MTKCTSSHTYTLWIQTDSRFKLSSESNWLYNSNAFSIDLTNITAILRNHHGTLNGLRSYKENRLLSNFVAKALLACHMEQLTFPWTFINQPFCPARIVARSVQNYATDTHTITARHGEKDKGDRPSKIQHLTLHNDH